MSRRTLISPGATNGASPEAGSTRRTRPQRSRTLVARLPAMPTTRRRWRSPDGSSSCLSKEHETALNAIERAISLNASCAMAHYYGALVNAFADRPKAALFHANRALRLSPFDPKAFEAHLALGMAAISEGRYDEAAASFARASEINPNESVLSFFHAIALALAGRETTRPHRCGGDSHSTWVPPPYFLRIRHGASHSGEIRRRRALLGLPE